MSPVRTRLWSSGDLSLLDELGLDLWRPNGDRTATESNGHRSWWTELGDVFVWAGDDLLDSTGRPTLNR